VRLINILLRHRRVVLGVIVLTLGGVVGWTLMQRRYYTATVAFMPRSAGGGPSELTGIAAQFGIEIPTFQGGQSTAFYADYLQSLAMLRAVVESEFRIVEASSAGESDTMPTLTGDLVHLYEVRGDTYALGREAAIKVLRNTISVRTDLETGVVTLEVMAHWASLARDIAARMLELVVAFDNEQRQTQAGAERHFLEGRLRQVQYEVRASEDELETFLEENRDFGDSPQLRFEHDRLRRVVTLRQEVSNFLAQSYEQARIDEIRTTPVITIVESPVTPVLPNPRFLFLRGLLGLIVGAMVGVLAALGREFLNRSRVSDSEEFAVFLALRRASVEDILRVWRAVIRPWRHPAR